MSRKTLNHLAMPNSTEGFARQALRSARRRRLQMKAGNEPVTAPGESPVSHYKGPADEIVLGGEPLSLVDNPTIKTS